MNTMDLEIMVYARGHKTYIARAVIADPTTVKLFTHRPQRTLRETFPTIREVEEADRVSKEKTKLRKQVANDIAQELTALLMEAMTTTKGELK